jgi:NADPH-dependent glutamate synthase beta subunit-like oxidoreductase
MVNNGVAGIAGNPAGDCCMSERQRYMVELADTSYFRKSIKCQYACPVGTDAGGYVRAIANGDFQLAYLIARGPNPLASMCGRVCGAPCEAACRRREIDQAVSIRALKRFAFEQFSIKSKGLSPLGLLRKVIDSAGLRYRRSSEDLTALLMALGRSELHPPAGDKVAIIGSGPAGLAAAHDLAVMGFRPTIYDMEPVPAGMLAVGIPEYRLPRNLIRAEIEVIRALGVEFVCNTHVGKDITLPELRQQHAATLIAVGAKRSRALSIPGHDGIGVVGGVEMLREVALRRSSTLGPRVVVIGGGNVAFDVARTVVRQAGMDVSRTALRAPGVREVHLCCLESLEEMPADDVEIIEGHEEGVKIWNSLGPTMIHLDEERRVRSVSFKRVLSVFDERGRFAPTFDESDITTIEADSALWAIGQQTDLSFLDPRRDGIRLTERGMIDFDPTTQATSAADVFVAGDAAHGAGLMIEAIASGKLAARSIHRSLRGTELVEQAAGRHACIPRFEREHDYEKLVRLRVPASSVEHRTSAQDVEVEEGYTEPQAFREAARCLDCGVNTVFDSAKCVLCGGCVDVCPEDCLRIVSVGRLEAAGETREVLDALCADFSPEEGSAIIKDEARCIRCGQCADRCPVGAITMEQFLFEGAWHEQRAGRTTV